MTSKQTQRHGASNIGEKTDSGYLVCVCPCDPCKRRDHDSCACHPMADRCELVSRPLPQILA
jgi:hypothetical protein